ncbi:MAG: heme A synthase [Candidatus Eremiobacteraeota bacterium]|nr:heme A synthase [Candidatus Eremiobacteraeota bacterium]
MKSLWRFSLVTAIVAYGAVMMGSWTRINGAGMTCPDWPLCNGQLIPSMADGTVWEWTHRLLVFLISPLVVAVMIVAWRERGRATFVKPALALVGVVFAFQVFLGAATVHLNNSPMSVVLHWGTAMAFIATLTAMAILARTAMNGETVAMPTQNAREVALSAILFGTTIVAFTTMCIGAYVSSSGAGLACISIPGCAGNVVVYSPGQYVQMLHRFAAAASMLSAAAALAFSLGWRTTARVRVSTAVGVGLVFVQVLLGLMNVALRLPLDLREAHAATAALVFLAFVVATVFAVLDAYREPAMARVR